MSKNIRDIREIKSELRTIFLNNKITDEYRDQVFKYSDNKMRTSRVSFDLL
jgi:hypothetical protein